MIVGNGSVTSDPAGIDCTGPKDCGTKAYAANASVKLVPTASAGFTLSKIDTDGAVSTDGVLRGASGATEKVTVTFVASGAGPGTSTGTGSGTGTGGGANDAGALADAGHGGVPDGTACTTPDGCGTSSVCCLRIPAQDRITPGGGTTSCESAIACRKTNSKGENGQVLCSAPGDARCGTTYACTIEGAGPGTCTAESQ